MKNLREADFFYDFYEKFGRGRNFCYDFFMKNLAATGIFFMFFYEIFLLQQ